MTALRDGQRVLTQGLTLSEDQSQVLWTPDSQAPRGWEEPLHVIDEDTEGQGG